MSARPRIAIPVPLSGNAEYVERSLPQYERAIAMAGGDPVRIPLDLSPAETMKLIERCDAVLLPGASADVDPAKYGAPRHEKTAKSDEKRDKVDELLLQDAYNMRKPLLGICYGLQILNVYRTGTLVQHIESKIDHEAGRKVPIAHTVEIEPSSRLFGIVSKARKLASLGDCAESSGQYTYQQTARSMGSHSFTPEAESGSGPLSDSRQRDVGREPETAFKTLPPEKHDALEADSASDAFPGPGGHDVSRVASQKQAALAAEGNSLPVNSSHHQSADIVGDGLRVVARCPVDGVIEALEGTAPNHFVLAVQWHPERSVDDQPSRAIFRAFVDAAKARHKNFVGEFESLGQPYVSRE